MSPKTKLTVEATNMYPKKDVEWFEITFCHNGSTIEMDIDGKTYCVRKEDFRAIAQFGTL